MDSEDFVNQNLPFRIVPQKTDMSSYLMCLHVNRNLNWRSAFMIKQNILIQLESMANIRYLVIDDFQYGSEISVQVSEYMNGPFVPVHTDKYFCRKKTRRILLSSLPCKFIRLQATKGVHINLKNVQLIGSFSEQLASEIDNNEIFRLMVTNPQRIMYE